ncbi:MAG: hypothetical protein RIT26_2083 [Pseudomonadota bacterium]|jgi:hypothetical protein
MVTDSATLHWTENGQPRQARWQTDNSSRLPTRIEVCTELDPAQAHRLASAGTGLLWRGDFQHARQLLQAMSARMEAAAERQRSRTPQTPLDAGAAFAAYRKAQGLRARVLGQLLIEIDGQYRIELRRAPDVRQACTEAWGPPDGQPCIVALRALLGLIGAHEWRKAGVPIAALGGDRIHPHHGVFSPVRGEYLDLIAQAPLPAALSHCPLAMDLGVGTGVLSALLVRRGVPRVLATDLSPRAIACADDNLGRLGCRDAVELLHTDLYPPVQAALVVCNPPWLPGQPGSALDQAIYDPDSAMLRGYLNGLAGHLCPGGEGWLVLSDLAERLGLRSREQLTTWIAQAGLRVIARQDTRPRHPKTKDTSDPLHAARAAEVTSLWRLGVEPNQII